MVLSFVLLACGEKLIPHGPSDLYPLNGIHFELPCAACHGPDEPEAQPTTCLGCHSEDLPIDKPHPPADECSICHDEWDWANVLPTAPPTDTGTTPPTTEPTGFVHPTVAADDLCWACHEETRLENGEDHHTDPGDPPESVDDAASRWDCAPCHQVGAGWATGPIEHPIRVPHGTKSGSVETPATAWIVACDDCHGGAEPAFDCTGCHIAVFDVFPHTDLAPDESSNSRCQSCHPTAEK